MDLEHILSCARFAKKNKGPGPLSTGEALAAAIVLDKPDWLRKRGYTLAEAFDRANDDGMSGPRFLQAQRIIAGEG